MKKTRLAFLAFAITASTLLSFRNTEATPIKGKVTPAWYGVHAWAISETDTLYTTIDNGNFEFPNAKPGVYRIVIEARSPYRHMQMNGIVVKDGEATDVGELSLPRWE